MLRTGQPRPAPAGEPRGGPHLPDVLGQLSLLRAFHLFPGHGAQLPVAQTDVPSWDGKGMVPSEGLSLWSLPSPLTAPA